MSVGAAEVVPAGDIAGDLSFLEAGGEIAARSPGQVFWRRLRRDRVAMVSLGFVIFLVIVAFAAPLIVKLLGLPGPYTQNLNLTDEFGSPPGPSAAHPFGVDQLGHDVMSRVIYGTRVSLEVGSGGTAVATAIGLSLGTRADCHRRLVVHGLSGRRAAFDGARLQPARRRIARRTQPKDFTVSQRNSYPRQARKQRRRLNEVA